MKQLQKNKTGFPFNWKVAKLGDICQICTGKKDVDEGNPEGKYPFFTCSREIAHSDTYSFDTEAILVAGNGDVGATKYYKGKFEAYQRTYVLDQFKESDIRFIYYFILAGLKKKLLQDKSGSTMPYVRKSDLESFEIYFPPLREQQKIVYVLDSIQEAVRVQEKIIEKTKELKKAMMADLFRYGGPSFRKGRKLKKTEIGEIPENWEVVRLEQVGRVCSGDNAPQGEKYFKNGKYPFVRVQHFDGESTYVGKWDLINETAKKEYNLRLFPAETIIFPKSGASIRLEKRAKLKIPSCIVSHLCALIVNQDIVNTDFIFNYLKTTKLINSSAGSTLPYLNISKVGKFQIPLPPFPEQREIAEIFQTIDQKIEIEQKKKALYEELFKSMLNKLMTGEIRVNNINFS